MKSIYYVNASALIMILNFSYSGYYHWRKFDEEYTRILCIRSYDYTWIFNYLKNQI